MRPGLAMTTWMNSDRRTDMPDSTSARRSSSARGVLPPGSDHRLVFELLIGLVHARTLLSPDTLDNVKTTTIVNAVLNGVAKPA
jgi:hypothetical protein